MKSSQNKSALAYRILLAVTALNLLFWWPFETLSQEDKNLEITLYDFVEENGEQVLQPYADALSGSMNSGLFHTANVKKGFTMYIGVKAIGTYINAENQKVFDANKTLDIVPLAVPQLHLGSLFGTEMTVRVLPQISIGNYGSVGTWGIGIRHEFTSHFKKSPIDAAVQLSFNNLTIANSKGKDMVEARSFAVSLQVSKRLSMFTFYSGLQYENTEIDAVITKEASVQKMSYENCNKVRGTIGLNIKMGPLNLNYDYSVGRTNSMSAGFGFAF
ncbi:MAG: hypothetical protein L0Y79_08630 [Chlorobi bacterium]|nr:hypothetical protein [Chlorobiota bacterium]MCI0715977.1 hypothetical protein [Chlorobiota bacterium]